MKEYHVLFVTPNLPAGRQADKSCNQLKEFLTKNFLI
jgi:hypothetical protein